MKYNMISIDQSITATGITIWTEKDGYIYKLIETKKTKDTKSPTIDYSKRIMFIRDEIKKLCDQYSIRKGIIEGAAFGGSGKLYDLGGLAHATRIALLESGVEFIVIPPKTAKKYFTGNGNAKKEDMIQECKNRNYIIPIVKKYKGGIIEADDNVVDSMAFIQFLRDFYDDKVDEDFIGKVEYSSNE